MELPDGSAVLFLQQERVPVTRTARHGYCEAHTSHSPRGPARSDLERRISGE